MRLPKTVVVTMIQAKDFPAAWSSIRPLGNQLSSRRERIILLNDERNPDLASALGSLPHTTVVTPGENLGVARGRNALFEAAIERGADYVVSLDDDLYIPSDYLDVVDRVVAANHDGLGVFAPTVMKFTEFIDANPDIAAVSAARSGELEGVVTSDVLRQRITPGDGKAFYHLGTRGWKAHYLAPNSGPGRKVGDVLADAGLVRSAPVADANFLASDLSSRSIAADRDANDPQWVDTLPGGVSVFNAAMLDQIGLCDARFSPFGYEDADLCIRARRAGFRNAWIPSTVVLHDFANRGENRSPELLAFVAGRARALFTANHAANDELPDQVVMAMSSYPLDAQAVAKHRIGRGLGPEQTIASIAAFSAGYLDGASSSDFENASLLDRLARLSKGHVLESDAGVRWILHRLPMGHSEVSPILSGQVEVDAGNPIHTRAAISIAFADGLKARFSSHFSRDAGADGGSVVVHHLSMSGEGSGSTVQRIYSNLVSARPADSARVLREFLRTRSSVLGSALVRLFSISGRPLSVAVDVHPRPPMSIDAMARTPANTATGIMRLGLSVAPDDLGSRQGVE